MKVTVKPSNVRGGRRGFDPGLVAIERRQP